MTEQLKTLMDRAADRDFDAVDLDAITSAGDRTVRRRRIATGVAGVAALAAIGVTALVVGGDGDDRVDFSDDPFRTDVPMWTEGSVLHTPDRTYELGVDVLTFVRTSGGVLFTSPVDDERLDVYSFDGEGEPKLLGETGDPQLRSDPDSPYAGWLDQSGDSPKAVVVDQGTGEEVWSAPARLEYSFPIVAIDGTTAYLADADEHPTTMVDLVTGEETALGDAGRGFVDVEGELTIYRLEGRNGADLGLEVRHPDGTTAEIRIDDGGFGVISPGGRWVSGAADDVSVHDAATGEAVDLGATDDLEGFGYAWADADSLMVIAQPQGLDADQELTLLACQVPSGECQELGRFGDFVELFAIGDTDILWGLMPGDVDFETSESSAVETD
jgi:hypothetical protein